MPKEIPAPVFGGIVAVIVIVIFGGGWYMFNRPVPRPPTAPMGKVIQMSGNKMAGQMPDHPMAKGLAAPPPMRSGGKGNMPPMPMDPNMAARGGAPPMPGGMSPGMRPQGPQGQRPRFGIPVGNRPGMPGGALAGGMPDGAAAGMPPRPGSMSPGSGSKPDANSVPDNVPKKGEIPPPPPGAPKDVTVIKVDPHSIKIPKP